MVTHGVGVKDMLNAVGLIIPGELDFSGETQGVMHTMQKVPIYFLKQIESLLCMATLLMQ